MKKWIACIISCLLVCSTGARALEVSAQSAVLYDPISGSFLFEKQADERRSMASTTKIMTAAVAIGECGDLNEKVLVKKEYTEIEGSKMYLKPGERVSVYELLCGLLLSSGNDAAMAIADHVAGDIPAFADMMNERTEYLGLKNTHFENPSGLDGETHYTNARELAQIAAFAMENETFRKIVGSRQIKTESGRVLSNHNRLLSMYEYSDGVKTGFTRKSGRCLVTSASKGDRRLIAVTLSAPDDWNDHIRMMEYGFSLYSGHTLAEKGEDVCLVPVAGENPAAVYAGETVSFDLTETEAEKVTKKIYGRKIVYPPFSSGDLYGEAVWYLNDMPIGQTPLYYGISADRPEPVEKSLLWNLRRMIAN